MRGPEAAAQGDVLVVGTRPAIAYIPIRLEPVVAVCHAVQPRTAQSHAVFEQGASLFRVRPGPARAVGVLHGDLYGRLVHDALKFHASDRSAPHKVKDYRGAVRRMSACLVQEAFAMLCPTWGRVAKDIVTALHSAAASLCLAPVRTLAVPDVSACTPAPLPLLRAAGPSAGVEHAARLHDRLVPANRHLAIVIEEESRTHGPRVRLRRDPPDASCMTLHDWNGRAQRGPHGAAPFHDTPLAEALLEQLCALEVALVQILGAGPTKMVEQRLVQERTIRPPPTGGRPARVRTGKADPTGLAAHLFGNPVVVSVWDDS
mmetsp:Transcript_83780/g.260335  ORF Transcript_83780/g.260335 Transcript_83780/m.260335 type:complete len:317 (+) Transcript_83780:539-1489(+)